MARIEFTYEHPIGSGEEGCKRNFEEDFVHESNRGPLRTDEVVVGDRIKTTPRCKCLVLAVAPWTAE
jgi:hypothetical protein